MCLVAALWIAWRRFVCALAVICLNCLLFGYSDSSAEHFIGKRKKKKKSFSDPSSSDCSSSSDESTVDKEPDFLAQGQGMLRAPALVGDMKMQGVYHFPLKGLRTMWEKMEAIWKGSLFHRGLDPNIPPQGYFSRATLMRSQYHNLSHTKRHPKSRLMFPKSHPHNTC